VLFFEFAPKTNQDIGMLTLPGLTKPTAATPPPQASANLGVARKGDAVPLIQTTFNEVNAEVSPDGRWVAYQSNESGSNQVYVRPFPNVDTGHWQVSTGGGNKPLWARNGRELFYEVGFALMVVTVQTTGAMFSAGNPTKLFDAAPYYFTNSGRTYDVSADGQQLLMIKLSTSSAQNSTATAASLIVVEHWTEELKARVPAK
jgi:serine/threonine-protein kinase